MAQKTTQALKINASWTPFLNVADKMMAATVGKTAAKGTRFAGGRLSLKHSIKIDFADPAQATRVSARVAEIKEALAATGDLHSFTTTAGAVPVNEAEVLPEPEPEVGPETVTGDGTGEASPPADNAEKSSDAVPRGSNADDAEAQEIPGRKSRRAAAE